MELHGRAHRAGRRALDRQPREERSAIVSENSERRRAAGLTDESVCPTLLPKDIHPCGAGAFACQPISSQLQDHRFLRSVKPQKRPGVGRPEPIICPTTRYAERVTARAPSEVSMNLIVLHAVALETVVNRDRNWRPWPEAAEWMESAAVVRARPAVSREKAPIAAAAQSG